MPPVRGLNFSSALVARKRNLLRTRLAEWHSTKSRQQHTNRAVVFRCRVAPLYEDGDRDFQMLRSRPKKTKVFLANKNLPELTVKPQGFLEEANTRIQNS